MRKLILFGALALAAVALIGVRRASGASKGGADTPHSESNERRLEVRVTPEMLRHSRTNDVLYFVDVAWGIGALLLVLGAKWSARLRDIASRAARKSFLAAMLYFVLLSLVITLLELPLDFSGGLVVPHQFDLTDQDRKSVV